MERQTKVLITGAGGFIGKNLRAHLAANGYRHILPCDRQTPKAVFEEYAAKCDIAIHLAGVNRPPDDAGYEENPRFARELVRLLKKRQSPPPVLFSSSMQALLDNPYGRSKKMAEEVLKEYHRKTGAAVRIFRLPGVFGKWCAPDYNSVVATFCHRIARGLPVRIDDPSAPLDLVYIDDVLRAITLALENGAAPGADCEIGPVYHSTVGELNERLCGFDALRRASRLPDLTDPFARKLHSTFLSHLPEDALGLALRERRDHRGVFAECLKLPSGGQISVNVAKPGMTKGGHWHHTKTEKIVVASGSGVVRFRGLGEESVTLHPVSADRLEMVDVPPGRVHDVVNTGETDMVMLIWASETFNPENPDTYPASVDARPREGEVT